MIKLDHKSLNIKKLFQKSLVAFPDLIFLVSHDGMYLDYLGNEKNLFVPPEEFIGKKIIDVMPRNIAKLHMDAIRKTLETKQMQTLEISLPIRGETRYFEDRFIYFSKEHIVAFVRDITKRKQAEQKLRKSEEKLRKFNQNLEQMLNDRTKELKESEEKYRFLFENSPIAMGLANSEGQMIDINKILEEQTGYNLEDFNNIGLQASFVNLDDRTSLYEVLEKYDRIQDFEVKLRRKNGTEYFALLNIDVFEVKEEKRFLSTMRDITERKNAEQKLRDSEKRLFTLLDGLPAFIYLQAPDYSIRYANQYLMKKVILLDLMELFLISQKVKKQNKL